HGFAQLDTAVVADRIRRDRAVAEIRDEDGPTVLADDGPAHLATGTADDSTDRLELCRQAQLVRGCRGLADCRARCFGHDDDTVRAEIETVRRGTGGLVRDLVLRTSIAVDRKGVDLARSVGRAQRPPIRAERDLSRT